jgi:Flp pilus assembly protein TadB
MTHHEILQLLASVLCGASAAAAWEPLSFFVDRISLRYVGDLDVRARQLGMHTQHIAMQLRFWWAFVIIFTGFVWGVLGMPPVALLLCILMISLPRTVLAFLAERRRLRLRDQMVAATRSLASQLRAGLDIPAGLKSVAEEISPPLSHELKAVVTDYHHRGVSLSDSLTQLRERLRIEAISMFSVAVVACMRRGGDLTRAMENISLSLEQLQRLEQKRDSNTASGRLLVLTLAAFPFCFGGFFWMIDPQSMSLVSSTTAGQLVLSAAILLTYIAVRWAFWLIAAID